MNRKQFLRNCALFAVAAAALPLAARAAEEEKKLYRTSYGRFVDDEGPGVVCVEIRTSDFTSNGSYSLEVQVFAHSGGPYGLYRVRRISDPWRIGDTWYADFEYASSSNSDVYAAADMRFPRKMQISLEPNVKAGLELEPGSLVLLKYIDTDPGCLLTTACTVSRGLPDACRELTALRRLRDEHLLLSSEGKAAVVEYYNIAPRLVRLISRCEHPTLLWEQIYQELILPTTELVEADELEQAGQYYQEYVRALSTAFA